MSSFIEVYQNALSDVVCDELIRLFEQNTQLHTDGYAGRKLDPTVKKSREIALDYAHILNTSSDKVIPWQDPVVKFFEQLNTCLESYKEKYSFLQKTGGFLIDGGQINFQRYLPGEGFYEWHCDSDNSDDRELVFMCYLNNVPDGGTEFGHGLGSLEARKGDIILWPPHWTHPHRGIISQTQTKYILTGWLTFEYYAPMTSVLFYD